MKIKKPTKFLQIFKIINVITSLFLITACSSTTPNQSNFYSPLPNTTQPNTNLSYSYQVSSNDPSFRFAVPNYNPLTKEEFYFPDARNRPDLNNGLDKNGKAIPITLPQAGYSPNKHYDKNFKTSFNFVFENRNKTKNTGNRQIEGGTGWILDYQKTTNESYPTIWYFATNAHVLDKLYSKTSYGPYNDFNDLNWETANFQIIKWTPPSEGFRSFPWNDNYARRKMYETGDQTKIISDRSYSIKAIPKTVYVGTDFLNTKPTQYNKKLYDEEIIDFGVMEVEFANAAVAKEITSDYANWAKADRNKFLQTSYLKQPNQIKPYSFYLAGFPAGIPTINRISMGSENSDLPTYRENETSEQTKQYAPLRERGASLGYWQYLSTFSSKDPRELVMQPLFYHTFTSLTMIKNTPQPD